MCATEVNTKAPFLHLDEKMLHFTTFLLSGLLQIKTQMWRGKWQPTPVFLPGEFHGRRNLAGYSPRSRKELDRTKQLTHT